MIMKNSTRAIVYKVLTGAEVSEEEKALAISEIETEMQKEVEEKQSKEDAYTSAWEAVHEVLQGTNSPLTVAEIAAKAKLPEGFTKGQVQYGVTHQWADNLVKIVGKPNSYRLK